MNKNYYAIIPANVRYDKDLTPNAKLLYGEITALCNEKGYCWASNSYFSELYNTKKETISRWISQLVKKGYLSTEIIYKEGTKEIDKRNIYIVSVPIDKKINTPIDKNQKGNDEKINTPIDKKVKDNNTLFNNTINNTNIYSRVVDVLNKKANKNYKHTTTKTRSLINARLTEGFTEEDLIKVINVKCETWLNTNMEMYLRPETLFGNKFEGYLNENQKIRKENNKDEFDYQQHLISKFNK